MDYSLMTGSVLWIMQIESSEECNWYATMGLYDENVQIIHCFVQITLAENMVRLSCQRFSNDS